MSANVGVLLKKIDEGVEEVRSHYETNLAAKKVSAELLYAVRHVIQDVQSALDWTATAVENKYSKGNGRPYFPLTKEPKDFPVEMEKQIRGLSTSQPGVVAAFERHQPYNEGKAPLGLLHALARIEKHQDFSPQTRVEKRRRKTGGVSWNPDVIIPSSPSGGMWVNGVKVHGDGADLSAVETTIYVDWIFSDLSVPVLPTLEGLAQLTRSAVEDVRREAQL
jgi:hypothetical protein